MLRLKKQIDTAAIFGDEKESKQKSNPNPSFEGKPKPGIITMESRLTNWQLKLVKTNQKIKNISGEWRNSMMRLKNSLPYQWAAMVSEYMDTAWVRHPYF